MLVVIAEDDLELRRLLEEVAGEAGHEVRAFDDGAGALDFFRREKPEGDVLLVTDCKMPGMDGESLLRHLLDEGVKVPAVAITGYADAGVEERLRAFGVVAVLSKPVDVSVLMDVFKKSPEDLKAITSSGLETEPSRDVSEDSPASGTDVSPKEEASERADRETVGTEPETPETGQPVAGQASGHVSDPAPEQAGLARDDAVPGEEAREAASEPVSDAHEESSPSGPETVSSEQGTTPEETPSAPPTRKPQADNAPEQRSGAEAVEEAGAAPPDSEPKPVENAAPSAVLSGSGSEAPSPSLRLKGRVLVTDDDPEFAAMLCTTLEGEGYEVSVVSNGEEALEAASSRHFSLVFMDLMMPGMGGVEAIRRIHERYPGLLIVAVTGVAGAKEIDAARRAGAFKVLLKPLNVVDLRQQLEDWSLIAARRKEITGRYAVVRNSEREGFFSIKGKRRQVVVLVVLLLVLMGLAVPGIHRAVSSGIQAVGRGVRYIKITAEAVLRGREIPLPEDKR